MLVTKTGNVVDRWWHFHDPFTNNLNLPSTLRVRIGENSEGKIDVGHKWILVTHSCRQQISSPTSVTNIDIANSESFYVGLMWAIILKCATGQLIYLKQVLKLKWRLPMIHDMKSSRLLNCKNNRFQPFLSP